MFQKHSLAPAGSTGNVTGAALHIDDNGDAVILQFVIEAVGATPTVTYKYQGSVDGTNWFDVAYITDASDTTAVATRVRTTVGADIQFVSNPLARKYKFLRVVTSANTNVTFRAETYLAT